ncbi:cingulin-like [Alligator mississippiensis]|uniref:Cingulin n=1 Tax=Alligator mississippiensis TaxID=8496 RepID=A0A151M597_ALLMI|nr:cingulin-like [Alligator mississippiensis]
MHQESGALQTPRMDRHANGAMAEKQNPVDYGVQIRFIDDLTEPKKPHKMRSKAAKPSSYGVAVRVQGIDGQPFVVLNSGERGSDSFGVQIKSESAYSSLPAAQPSPASSPSRYPKEASGSLSSDSDLPENPYAARRARYSTSDEEQSSRPRGKGPPASPARSPSPQGGRRPLLPKKPFSDELRRTQSHSSLLGPESGEPFGPSRPSTQTNSTAQPRQLGKAKSGSMVNIAVPKGPEASEKASSAFGRRPVDKQPPSDPESSRPGPPAATGDIDTKPLSSVDSLISKFDGKVQQRGRTARRSPDSRELTTTKHGPGFQKGLKPPAVAMHASSLPRTRREDLKTSMASRSQPTRDWANNGPEEPLVEQQQSQVQSELQLKSTPDLLKDQQETSPAGSSEHMKELIYAILKDGSKDSEVMLKRKANLLLEKVQELAVPPEDAGAPSPQQAELARRVEELQHKLDEEMKLRQKLELTRESPRSSAVQNLELQLARVEEECQHLQGALEKKSQELQSSLRELSEVKRAREQAEARLGDCEEQLMGMQEELDRLRQGLGDVPEGDALLKDLLETREELEEVLSAKQRQEEHLRLRERELTALKGALKEEVASHDKELDQLRQQYQHDVDQLRRSMEDVSQDQADLETERQKINSIVRNLQRELAESTEETGHWRDMFQKNKEELRSTKQELMQVKLEREEFEEELRELRERFSAVRLQADQARSNTVGTGELEALKKELRQTQEERRELTAEKQAQDELLRQRERELLALKVTLQETAGSHSRELEQLREQFQRSLQQLQKDSDEAVKGKVVLESEREVAEQTRRAVEATLRETQEHNDDLRRKVLGLEAQLKDYQHVTEDWEGVEARLKDKIAKLEAERRQMEETLGEASDQEQELLLVKRALENRLDEAQRSLSRLSLEHQELSSSYQEELRQKEQLKRLKMEMEEQKRLLDRTIEKLTKELEQMAEESHHSLALLQSQLEDYKEKSRKELGDSQKQAKDRGAELEKAQFSLARLQDEVTRLKQALQDSQAERESAVLDREVLAQRLQHLEQQVEVKKRSQDDRSRQVKALEIDQLRAELLQERSSRQDLECDKISLERQNKDLKNRLASSEGLQKPSASLTQLESRVQELQDKLQAEEREKNVLVSSNRKLERKVKELTIQIDDERQHVNDQKDQLSLRVKALKRQVDEAEEEIERLEGARKKAQWELEEQHELNEQLQNRVKTLEKEAWRKAARSAAEASLKDDQLSSDEEFDSAYGPSSIASLLTEANLQTSSC